MKKISLLLTLALLAGILAGCAGTPVIYYTDCTCPAETGNAVVQQPAPQETLTEGALKIGLAITTSISESKSAGEADGEGKYDVTMAAVLVDDAGVIHDCIIDGISASVKFDASGTILSDLTAAPQTKNELGEGYNMKTWGNAIAEWDEQAAAFASYVIGKTVEEVKGIAVDTQTKPTEADLASSVTIKIGGFVSAVEQAVANAQHLGAQTGDILKLASINTIGSSKSAEGETAGNAQLDATVTAMTMNGGTITSCIIDAVQAKVAFDASGVVTSDVSAPVQTKNALGEGYNMKAWGNAIAEWDEQAAAFASYVVGKTVEEVQAIAVDEQTKPTEADLASSVTIKIGDFQTLVEKAAQ